MPKNPATQNGCVERKNQLQQFFPICAKGYIHEIHKERTRAGGM